ncbi:replication factor C small subunit [Oceanobacillus picturae]|jgi:MoxR-like ATPase|uniref:Replication factor C small subunit n=1 Tax=Oceanobacillus picturae TaxID=171693 RepID=W9B9I2_9BACI|nr:MoxR family ATPase [Oceanobacillus picturae]RIU94591.1 MoxR family ATPase [Oceanobacillus picturae]GAQ18583.1 replication factor C small subunit [Oceanobacillus picturae]CDO03165.1 replication factor C small subunit [Oceanobacillus picturae]
MGNLLKAREDVNNVIYGKEEVVDLLFVALLAQGHVLLESVPGTGKTKLAKSFAKVMNGTFSRVQFTPDVLPSDITGIRFFNPKVQEFELRIGPIATNVLLADEINRATPKTQSSLLEAMEEYQSTVDGETIKISLPFIVIATQNPVESNYGTFPLPEAQLDRFLFKLDLGYPSLSEEKRILNTYRRTDPYDAVEASLSIDTIRKLQDEIKLITVSEVVADYLLELVHASREHSDVELGISPRGMLALMRAGQAYAYIKDRDYVTPQDIKTLVPYVFEHRLILSMEGSIKKTAKDIVKEIIHATAVPVEEGAMVE